MDCSPQGPSVPGISQSRILEWVAISFSRGSSRPYRTRVSCIACGFFTNWATSQAQVISVQSLSCVRLFVIPWTAARQASLSSPTLRVYSNSCPSSRWCHATISSSVGPLPSHFLSFPASLFPMSWFFASGSQSIGISASASVLPMNSQDWFPLGLTGWISLRFNEYSGLIFFKIDWFDLLSAQETLKSLLQLHCSEASIIWCSAFFMV